MEIVSDNEATLSNFEVMDFLLEEKKRHLAKNFRAGGSVATLLLETVSSLESSPCQHQDADSVQEFLRLMEPFNLTPSERLMLLNHCPTSQVEIHLLIEESDERLKEGQDAEIIDIIRRVLLKEPVREEEEGDKEEEEEDVKADAEKEKS